MDETLREFFNDVYEITRQIPRGKVLTYGRIAALAGRPQHARWVGRAMAQSPDDKTLRDGPNNGRYSKTKGSPSVPTATWI